MPVDLHLHSTASDGTQSPQEVVRAAKAAGLTAIAISDHDTFDGVGPALAEAEGCGIDVIPAVEISAQLGKRELHVLGYLIDPENPELTEALSRVRESRTLRAKRIVERLVSLGVRITFEDVAQVAGGESVGRPHVATALVECGAVASMQEAFARYLRRGRPAYVQRYRLEAQEALGLIENAQGMSSLAHPGLGCPDHVIHSLSGQGLVAIEAYHVDHTSRQTQHYLSMARKLGLAVTGGSDSHGPKGTTPVEVGQVPVPDECAEAIREWGRQRGRWPSKWPATHVTP